MKKLYSALCCLLLAGMLLVGMVSLFDKDATYSEREKRPLKTKPKFLFSSLLDGSFTSELNDYYADTFPGRESLMNSNRTLNGFYYFSGTSGDLIIDKNSGAADHGEALPGTSTAPDTSDGSGETGEPGETTEPPLTEPPEPDGAVEQLGSVLLVGDRALDIPYANNEMIRRYAAAVTSIATDLGSEVRTFSIPVPNAAEFYTPKKYRTDGNSQTKMIDLCRENLGSNVIFVDTYESIARHTDEYLYFRSDHHWTQLGAYYAYTAFCNTAGLTPVSLDQFQTGKWENFVGSLYTNISDYPQSQVLKDNPDTVHYYKTFVECTTNYYSDSTLSDPYPIGSISGISPEVDNKYLTFLGGDHPITIIDTGKEGPVCMLIKESYGNAFAPWLINNYSKVIAVDPREFNRSGKPDLDLSAFAAEQGVDDCIILNYPMMLNSKQYITWLERLVEGVPEG